MPSAITHAAAGAAAALAFLPTGAPKHLAVAGVVCSILPDLDVVSFFYRLPYHPFFAHRGFFHSLFFSLILSLAVFAVFFRRRRQFSLRPLSLFIFLFLLSAGHGLLDALNSGGYGVALFLPFDSSRYSFPWTPLPISPIGLRSFFSPWGWAVVKSEILWIWLPGVFLVIASRLPRWAFSGRQKWRIRS